jgi:mRNA-degrading endonuclease RelE of RelBE toxin-antitoxin system
VKVDPTKAFAKAVRRLDPDVIQQVFKAVSLFCDNPNHPGVNFEAVTNKPGVYTIRGSSALRIFLQATDDPELFQLVNVGNHDLYR